MESSDAIKWKEACDSEMESLHKNETWILVPLPKGRKAIGNRWVFRVKENQAGEIERFKARLVAKGFLQKYDIYMAQPDGYIDEVHPDYVCKLKRSLYVLAR
ncbi:hypothetical protein PC121_g25429 [Phytophthora cactorum]|nr:hypothetical protein PC121_g25429 [Phytophthora cactorum]